MPPVDDNISVRRGSRSGPMVCPTMSWRCSFRLFFDILAGESDHNRMGNCGPGRLTVRRKCVWLQDRRQEIVAVSSSNYSEA
jgi:hypothetical protein